MAENKNKFTRFLMWQVLVIGFIKMGETVFFFFEQNYLNLYLEHVLGKEEIYITVMVSTSAIMGLIFQFVWGIISDNTRTKYGRRRPYFIFGGLISGISMIVYAFSQSFSLCLILDGFIIAVGTNAYLAAERSLIPDTFEPRLRGRANGIISILGNVGLVVALALFLVAESMFGYEAPGGQGTYLTQQGFIVLLSIGGVFITAGGIMGFLFVRELNLKELPPKKKFMAELKETFQVQELRKHKEFGKLIIALVIFRTGTATIMPFLFSYIFSLGMTTIQLLVAIMVVSFPLVFVFSYFIGKLSDKYGRKKFILIAIIVVAIMVSIAPLVGDAGNLNYTFALISFPFIMIALLGFAGPLDAWAQDLLPEAKRGQFNGILNVTFTLSQVFGSIIAASVVDLDDPVTKKWIFPAAAVSFVLSIPFFIWVKDTLKNNYLKAEKVELDNNLDNKSENKLKEE